MYLLLFVFSLFIGLRCSWGQIFVFGCTSNRVCWGLTDVILAMQVTHPGGQICHLCKWPTWNLMTKLWTNIKQTLLFVQRYNGPRVLSLYYSWIIFFSQSKFKFISVRKIIQIINSVVPLAMFLFNISKRNSTLIFISALPCVRVETAAAEKWNVQTWKFPNPPNLIFKGEECKNDPTEWGTILLCLGCTFSLPHKWNTCRNLTKHKIWKCTQENILGWLFTEETSIILFCLGHLI